MNGWISVKDRLPDDDRTVLVYCRGDGRIGTAYYDYEMGYFFPRGRAKVSYWMEMPEPPEDAEGKRYE